jgi:hypothetical protein
MPHADLTELIDAGGGEPTPLPSQLAATTAATLIAAAREGSTDPAALVAVADRIGIETLAALWRPADPVSLPGSLWALYLLRHWCHSSPDYVARLWRAGEPVLDADPVVAGVDIRGDAAAVQATADAILTRAFVGDFGVALERAAAFFRVIAAGRRALAPVGDDPDCAPTTSEAALVVALHAEFSAAGGARSEAELAAANDAAAVALSAAAELWRRGALA